MSKAKRKQPVRSTKIYPVLAAVIILAAIVAAGCISGGFAGTIKEGAEYTPYFTFWTLAYFGLAVLIYVYLSRTGFKTNDTAVSVMVPSILAAAFILQCVVGAMTRGYLYDIGTNMAWASQAGSNLFNIYNSASFIDYPPGMMYIWAPLAWLDSALLSGSGLVMVVKLPGIICNIILSWLAYKWFSNRRGRAFGTFAMALVAFCPLTLIDTCLWGQTDSVLMLFVILAVYFIYNNRFYLGTVCLAVAVIIKPQAIFTFPLLAFELIRRVVICPKDKRLRRIGEALLCIVIGAAVCFGAFAPFCIAKGGVTWIFDLFMGTATEYNYAALNAFNFWSMLGHNTHGADQTWVLFSFNTWGKIFVVIITLAAAVYNFFSKSKYRVPITAVALNFGYFMFATVMHERYIFPATILMIFTAFLINNKAVYAFAGGITLTAIANVENMLYLQQINNYPYPQTDWDRQFVLIISVINFLLFITMVVFMSVKCRDDRFFEKGEEKTAKAVTGTAPAPRSYTTNGGRGRFPFIKFERPVWTKWDWILMAALTVIYGVVAFTYLGTLNCPESAWTPTEVGEYITIKLDGKHALDRFYMYEGVRQRALDDYVYKVFYVDEEGDNAEALTINGSYATYCDWKYYGLGEIETDTLVLRVETLGAPIDEICVTEVGSREALPIVSVTHTAADGTETGPVAEITDEQDTFDYGATMLTGMIFDEIYHARTAYEHIHGISQYETTHPPLGKLIIAVGILIFGMNTFGWRFMGTLFGVFMVPLMYAFGKKIFKKTNLAFISAALIVADFMHFTQTRLATIDTYVVFFIILMFYFMYDCFVYGAVEQSYKRYVAHLAVCGIMFGLGCAAKWIGMYAGVGLAVLFFMGKYNEISEYSRRIRDFMNKYFWRIVLLCCIFFVVIPLTIYMLSYIPVQAAEGHAKGFKAWWDAQTLMFNYHSGLVAEHPFSSDWWEWPLDIRPVLLYRGYDLPTGMTSSASTMGNPLIWWLSVPSVIAAAVIAWKKRDRRALPVLAAYLSQYVPWMLVPRLVFIYHYFSCVPFAILAIVYVMEYLMENYRHAKYFCYAFTGVCVILFATFWPVLSGYPVSNDYVNALRWLQSWPF